MQSGWETAAEDYMIHLFRPIWNSETSILYGLGKHGDDATTRANKRSPWDTLHPWRKWAEKSKEDAKSPETIDTELTRHFQEHPVFPDLEHVLTSFWTSCVRSSYREAKAIVRVAKPSSSRSLMRAVSQAGFVS
nr:Eco29kI family restriction endonuclease [Sphingomonas paucimobilis]